MTSGSVVRKTLRAFATCLMFLIAVLFILPLFNMVLTTFKEDKYIYDPFYWPSFTYLENYRLVFESSNIFRSMANTILICAVTLSLMIVIASFAGYRIARTKKRIYQMIFALFAMTLIVPPQTNMVILFKMGTSMHLINTIAFLILLYLGQNVGYSSMVYCAFTKSITREIEESAMIDGCGKFRSFLYIVFPLLMPASGTILVTQIFWYWNDFQGPLIYLSGSDIKTLMLEVFNFRTTIGTSSYTSTQWGPVTTICFLSIIPILAFFMVTQKYMIRGINIGGVKG